MNSMLRMAYRMDNILCVESQGPYSLTNLKYFLRLTLGLESTCNIKSDWLNPFA